MSRLRQRFRSRPGAGRQSAAREEAERERMHRMNRLCVAMVLIFGTCWLPLNVINFVADINVVEPSIYCWSYHNFTFFLCHVLAMSSNCYNPFLYGWLNDAFRQEFLKMLPILATVCGGGGTGNRRSASPNGKTNRTVVANNNATAGRVQIIQRTDRDGNAAETEPVLNGGGQQDQPQNGHEDGVAAKTCVADVEASAQMVVIAAEVQV